MKKKYLLLPGNPSAAHHYETWAKEFEIVNPELNVSFITSYVIFDKKLDYFQYDAAMRKYYEDTLLKLADTEQVTIIAHSVGSYFALRFLEKFPEKISNVVVMFPYLWYTDAIYVKYLYPVYVADKFLPVSETVSKFKNVLFGRSEPEILHIDEKNFNMNLRYGVRQCVYFNKTKFEKDLVQRHKDKIHFLYIENDQWCPKQTIEEMKEVVTHKKIDLPHHFILNKDHREQMMKVVLGILN